MARDYDSEVWYGRRAVAAVDEASKRSKALRPHLIKPLKTYPVKRYQPMSTYDAEESDSSVKSRELDRGRYSSYQIHYHRTKGRGKRRGRDDGHTSGMQLPSSDDVWYPVRVTLRERWIEPGPERKERRYHRQSHQVSNDRQSRRSSDYDSDHMSDSEAPSNGSPFRLSKRRKRKGVSPSRSPSLSPSPSPPRSSLRQTLEQRRDGSERPMTRPCPLDQFIHELSQQREDLIRIHALNQSELAHDINSKAYNSVRASWEQRNIWDRRWGLLPGLSWIREKPTEEREDEGYGTVSEPARALSPLLTWKSPSQQPHTRATDDEKDEHVRDTVEAESSKDARHRTQHSPRSETTVSTEIISDYVTSEVNNKSAPAHRTQFHRFLSPSEGDRFFESPEQLDHYRSPPGVAKPLESFHPGRSPHRPAQTPPEVHRSRSTHTPPSRMTTSHPVESRYSVNQENHARSAANEIRSDNSNLRRRPIPKQSYERIRPPPDSSRTPPRDRRYESYRRSNSH